jgi:hypothetical protein
MAGIAWCWQEHSQKRPDGGLELCLNASRPKCLLPLRGEMPWRKEPPFHFAGKQLDQVLRSCGPPISTFDKPHRIVDYPPRRTRPEGAGTSRTRHFYGEEPYPQDPMIDAILNRVLPSSPWVYARILSQSKHVCRGRPTQQLAHFALARQQSISRTKQTKTEGIQATSRGEGQHGILKNELGTSRGDIKDVVDKFRLLLRRTNSEIRRFICCAPQRDKLIFLL